MDSGYLYPSPYEAHNLWSDNPLTEAPGGVSTWLAGGTFWDIIVTLFTDIWQLLVQADARWLATGFGWYLLTNILRSYRFAALMGVPGVLKPVRLLPKMIALSMSHAHRGHTYGRALFGLFWVG